MPYPLRQPALVWRVLCGAPLCDDYRGILQKRRRETVLLGSVPEEREYLRMSYLVKLRDYGEEGIIALYIP